MERRKEVVPIQLANGATVYIESTMLGGEQQVAFHEFSFQEVANAIEGIAQAVIEPLQKVKPRKATVEFGLEVAVKSGSLMALWVDGSGKANLKITLEWSE